MSELTAFDDEDIPADIWATAEGMALESDGHPGVWSLKESLARAIYIERERCAKIAENTGNYGSVWIPGSDKHTMACALAEEIASAIRRGTHK